MKKWTYFLLVIAYFLDLISTRYAMPDLMGEGNWLVKKYNLPFSELCLMDLFLLTLSLFFTWFFFKYKHSFGQVFFKIEQMISLENVKWLIKQSVILYCFIHIYSIIVLKLFAFHWNLIFGIYRWKSLSQIPVLQEIVNTIYTKFDPISYIFLTLHVKLDHINNFELIIPYYSIPFAIIYFYNNKISNLIK